MPNKISNQIFLAKTLQLTIKTPQTIEQKKLIMLATENMHSFCQQHKTSEKKEKNCGHLLLQLQQELKLKNFPDHIECIDVSHTSQTNIVGSLVTYIHGQYAPHLSRLYKLHKSHTNDCSTLQEILVRRFHFPKTKTPQLPNVILIDGGKAQLTAALEILQPFIEKFSIDLIAFAKEKARHDKRLTKERIFLPGQSTPIALPPQSTLHFFLQSIRDAAHTKAINYHRKLQTKQCTKSQLDHIPGIGPIKKKRLLTKFGSVKNIQNSSIKELSFVISKKDAQMIHSFFQQNNRN